MLHEDGNFDANAIVHESRRRFATALNLDPDTLTVAGAVHGAQVARVDAPTDSIDGEWSSR